MKKFDRKITITVAVDDIANKLKASFDKAFPHADLVTEATISSLIDSNQGLTNLYNSLNGFTGDIDFKVGQLVHSKSMFYNGSERVEIGPCIIEEIDPWASNKVKVAYYKDSTGKLVNEWVDHGKLEGIDTDAIKNSDEPRIQTLYTDYCGRVAAKEEVEKEENN